MKLIKICLSALALTIFAQNASGATMKTNEEIASYSIGHNIGTQVKGEKEIFNVDIDLLVKGLKDAFDGKASEVPAEDIAKAFQHIQGLAEAKKLEDSKKALAENAVFLAENSKKEGVTKLPSGLQYEVIAKGDSDDKPGENDQVKVHYHGTLTDGTVFDSSVDRGEPITFPVTGVIKGWVEALQLMNVGDKWRLTIPSDLAYGERAQGPIPANSVLQFEVELLEIIKG